MTRVKMTRAGHFMKHDHRSTLLNLVRVSIVLTVCAWWCPLANANPDAKRLYDDLLFQNDYNVLIRPVSNHENNLTVEINLKLSALVDVDEKNEIITTNVWLMQKWTDSSLVWNPEEYGGVEMLYVPSENIWRPDIVLYNNADGDYVITMMTKATIRSNGTVDWQPPAIYKSQCDIDVEYFPFDEQKCKMKFGDWTYDGLLVDMRHSWNTKGETDWVEKAIDLSAYYKSVEWDLMSVRAKKNNILYPCCQETPYPDVTFHIVIRRKILYYTINLIIPCVSINLLTLLVFYLPADCGEKISICISIMLSLSLFQMLLMELVPGTSIVTPLIGKYLLFTCIVVSISVIASVIVLNISNRSGSTHRMYPLIRRVFLEILPRFLCMARPPEAQRSDVDFSNAHSELLPFDNPYKKASTHPKYDSSLAAAMADFGGRVGFYGPGGGSGQYNRFTDSGAIVCEACARRRLQRYPPNVHKALDSIQFIANHMASGDDSRRVKDDWKFLSKVVDRILLYVYITICCVVGMTLLLYAPALHDNEQPLPDGK